MRISFHGGVDGVTGSCHLLEIGDLRILIDCGMFQGGHEADEKNYDDFGFDPASVDYLLLTHGHLDHCGRIPLLVKRGFRGRIITTSATYDVAKIVLMDAAHLQEEDYERWQRIRKRRGEPSPPPPLFTTLDALDSLGYFHPAARYNNPLRLNNRIQVTFRDAGHIIGSSFLEIQIDSMRILFSGDLGNRGKPIIRDPSMPAEADVVMVETTYANRMHRSMDDSITELRDAINETFLRGGNVLIPAFAIERSQDLLYCLREFYEKRQIPECMIFLDSPMAISVTEVMKRHPECFDKETKEIMLNDEDPFVFSGVYFTRHPEESMKINEMHSKAIIIAGSGMCTGGRIKHHLKHNIWRDECSIVFTGYQAGGTLGRKIVDGERDVYIFGERYRVNARIHTIGGFSAHADKGMILDWLRHTGSPSRLFLVHGESEVIEGFASELKEMSISSNIHTPSMHEVFDLS
jgi:metallo-beta-lactamase family protein